MIDKQDCCWKTARCLPAQSFGAEGVQVGEVVFNTGMTGYQEVLSDPSYCGQIVTMTYPLIGNYGITRNDFESDAPVIHGLVVRRHEPVPSNWRAEYIAGRFVEGIRHYRHQRDRHAHADAKNPPPWHDERHHRPPASEPVEELQRTTGATPLMRDQVARVSTKQHVFAARDGRAHRADRFRLEERHSARIDEARLRRGRRAARYDGGANPPAASGRHSAVQRTGRSEGCAACGRDDARAARRIFRSSAFASAISCSRLLAARTR